jgi:para-nitrobenzyl esterase
MSRLLLWGGAALLCRAAAAVAAAAGGGGNDGGDAALVHLPTGGGAVRGLLHASGARSFRGIPYGLAPTGSRRWRPPLPAVPWHGVLDGRHASPSCLQPPGFSPPIYAMSEDCLTLSVYTPPVAGGTESPAAREVEEAHPTMVWIHGGSFTGGGANETRTNGEYVASSLQNVVIVVIQYRLGIFGWLGSERLRERDHPHGSTGNYGLQDQRLALRWVARNVAAFGGDPKNILIMGQSAVSARPSRNMDVHSLTSRRCCGARPTASADLPGRRAAG